VILAAILFFGILTMWVPARWALTAFQLALFALAIYTIARRKGAIAWNPVALLLAAAPAWGVLQLATHRTVDAARTRDAVLNWLVNLVAFSLAAAMASKARRTFLHALLVFALALSVVATFTLLTSPDGRIFCGSIPAPGIRLLAPSCIEINTPRFSRRFYRWRF
jgi:hypothetical protein